MKKELQVFIDSLLAGNNPEHVANAMQKLVDQLEEHTEVAVICKYRKAGEEAKPTPKPPVKPAAKRK